MDPAIERNGGDRQTFIVACKLVEFGLSQSDAMTVLLEYNTRCQPAWNEAGLTRKLRAAFSRAAPDTRFDDEAIFTPGVKERPKWPPLNGARQAAVIKQQAMGLSDLLERSPVNLESPSPQVYLNDLFPGIPLICCGKNSMQFWTKPLRDFGDSFGRMQLIVPSPMSALTGKIQDPDPDGPTESAHTKDNTGNRRFAVVEFDNGTSHDHAALLWHLADYAPLVMAVHSGGKSLHGWFFVENAGEDLVFRFYRYAVSIGADRATFLKSQFVRIPDGMRENGKRQVVYYFNPLMIDPL
jgi:hypothetical protein